MLFRQEGAKKAMHDVIIIGSGPAGLTAAVYTCRARLDTLVIGGSSWGGQLMLTGQVDNFPGFPDGLPGPELMEKMREQAEKCGAQLVFEDVSKVDFSSRPFKVTVTAKSHEAKTVIIATGASAKWLGLPSETRLRGKGVSACATCDAPFFRDKKVMVVGGGDTALEEALTLANQAREITIVHRRDQFRACKLFQEKIFSNPKITVAWNSMIEDILGERKVEAVRLKNVQTGEVKTVPADGVFIAVGHLPETALFKGQIALDPNGYIVVHDETKTSVEGVFAAGDNHDTRYKQAITAAGSGCKAALDAQRYLQEHSV
jgi:thioredoxin reductase (NADPH)